MSLTRTALGLAPLLAALALQGCAITIVDPGTSSSGSGAGTSSSAASGSGGAGGAGPACTIQDGTTCTCTSGDLGIVCSPKNGKIECVCSYGADFSGICFETHPSELCDFDKGCCANYFSGQ
jgi:hypothetical protein